MCIPTLVVKLNKAHAAFGEFPRKKTIGGISSGNQTIRPIQFDDTFLMFIVLGQGVYAVSYTHLRAHETVLDLVCRLLLEKKKHTTSVEHTSHTYKHEYGYNTDYKYNC